MKTYFAKYLPVEGEMGEDDFFIQRGEIKSIKTLRKELPGFHLGNFNNVKNTPVPEQFWPKKVKLFLCSRDIKVGDKILIKGDSFTYYEIIKIENGDYYFIGPNNVEALCGIEELIKVIGEISPDAIWVKEGDEFNEYRDVWYFELNGKWKYVGRNTVDWVKKRGSEIKLVCKVKGPCGHFH